MSYYALRDNAGRPYYVREPPLEPPDVNEPEEEPACECRRCKQDVWPGEYTFDGLCPDCFRELLSSEWTLREIAEQLGYDVTLC